MYTIIRTQWYLLIWIDNNDILGSQNVSTLQKHSFQILVINLFIQKYKFKKEVGIITKSKETSSQL